MLNFMKAGGPIMYLLIGLSISGLAIILEKSFFFIKQKKSKENLFISNLKKKLKDKDYTTAITICDEANNNNSKIIKIILKEYLELENNMSSSFLYEYLEEKSHEYALKEYSTLEKNMWILSLTATISPLAGLLGTVTGMISTFSTISEYGTGDPKLLSNGISQALVTTASGLIIAIPAIIAYNYFRKKIEKANLDLEQSIIEVLNILRKNRSNYEK